MYLDNFNKSSSKILFKQLTFTNGKVIGGLVDTGGSLNVNGTSTVDIMDCNDQIIYACVYSVHLSNVFDKIITQFNN